MNNAAFGNTAIKARRNYLVSKTKSYNKGFWENEFGTEMKKTQKFMNKPFYVGLSILEINKIVMFEFWYDCLEKQYREKAKLYQMDAVSFEFLHKNRRHLNRHRKGFNSRFDYLNHK